jgi:hypothetical protein
VAVTETRTYRCLDCREHTIEREYDVSHVSVTCDACGEFARFVHAGVYRQYMDFEESPPEDVAWERLTRMQKFTIVEGIVRSDKTLDDFDISGDAADGDETDEADDTDETDA